MAEFEIPNDTDDPVLRDRTDRLEEIARQLTADQLMSIGKARKRLGDGLRRVARVGAVLGTRR